MEVDDCMRSDCEIPSCRVGATVHRGTEEYSTIKIYAATYRQWRWLYEPLTVFGLYYRCA
mgnify:CR=1 FL=1